VNVLNALLILAPLATFVAGMIAPRWVLCWHRLPSRLFVVVLSVGLFWFDLGIGMWLTPMPDQDSSTPVAAVVVGAVFLAFSALQAKIWGGS
jgi:hypothetical protein